MLVGAGRGLLLLLARAAAFLFCLLLAPAARGKLINGCVGARLGCVWLCVVGTCVES